ncbi:MULTISPECIES: hypothetical protein [Serratia]|uniref:hypothetical protein n=1 Tax=Serratia TaxID=613 RepID=UPI0006616087|nr:hypothetical protein [Serratia sp. 506_PEND]
MEKNVHSTKQPEGSFEVKRKEPFSDKLKKLQNGRTVRQCAEDWGINLSTLKNYFSRPDATPRFDVLSKISSTEGVSIEWLLGDEDSFEVVKSEGTLPKCARGVWRRRLTDMLDLLDEDDLEALTKQLTLKGLETILYLLDEDNIALLKLDKVVKEKILGKQPQTEAVANHNYEKAKECGADNEERADTESLASDKKRAV